MKKCHLTCIQCRQKVELDKALIDQVGNVFCVKKFLSAYVRCADKNEQDRADSIRKNNDEE